MAAMTKEQLEKSQQKIREVLAKHESIRHMAREINEDPGDISRWLHGLTKIRVTAVVAFARYFGVKPHDLRPDWFPKDITFHFKP